MIKSLRIWVIASVLVIGALVVGGWALGVQPLLAAGAASGQAASAASAQTTALTASLSSLKAKSANLDALKAQAAAAAAAVPSDLDSEAFIASVNALARQDHVSVRAITPGTAQAYTVPASIVAAKAAAAPAPTATPSPSASASASTATTPTVVVKPEAVSDSRITASNFVVIPMTVTVHGSAKNAAQFTTDLRDAERVFLVNGYSAASDAGSGVTATLTGYVYSLKS